MNGSSRRQMKGGAYAPTTSCNKIGYRNEVPLPDVADTALSDRNRTNAATISGWRILVATADADMRSDFSRLLDESGFSVQTVNDGGAALAACKKDLPDLLICEVVMPGLDGIALLQSIRMDPMIAKLAVILLSERAGEYAMIQGLAAVPDDYLVKPFRTRELIARIERAICLVQFRAAVAARDRLGRVVMDNTSEGVLVTDEMVRIIAVNPAFVEITGYAAEEIIGQKLRFLSAPPTPQKAYAAMRNSLNETGCWRGELWNRRKNGELFLGRMTINAINDANHRPSRYVAVISDVTEFRRKERYLHHLAFYDPLTDLPNRVLLQDRLQHAIERANREQGRMAVLFIDLDHFKRINDTLGHEAGDALLQNVAVRLKSKVRSMDTIARVGGDEFVVMLEDLDDVTDCAVVASNLIAAVAKPEEPGAFSMQVSASVGIAIFPEDGATAPELLKQADTAMYAAKSDGGGTFRYAVTSRIAITHIGAPYARSRHHETIVAAEHLTLGRCNANSLGSDFAVVKVD